MPLYDFPLWATDVAKFPARGFRGSGWKIMAAEVALKHLPTIETRHFKSMRKKYPRYSVNYVSVSGDPSEAHIAPQIVLEASSRIVAQRVFGLLLAALTIIDGSAFLSFEDGVVIPKNRKKLEDLTSDDVVASAHQILYRDNVVLASKFAAALSRKRFLSYAVFKLKLSFDLASAHMMELNPRYSRKGFAVSASPSDHVRLASAITLAYSAIEELELEPRPKNKKNIKAADGSWEPNALADLLERLRGAGIDLKGTVAWSIRGSPTRIHRSARFPTGSTLPWTKGMVRDQAVKIEDALIAASWLRSRCSTHKYRTETQSITMFDVTNVQLLARRLLLERLDIWKTLTTPS